MSEKTNPLKGRTEYVTVQEIAVPELERFIAEHTGQLNKEE